MRLWPKFDAIESPTPSEQTRISDAQRGSGSPTGTPASPVNVRFQISEHSQFDAQGAKEESSLGRFARIWWDLNQESDILGYHVEMSYSGSGPWKRLNPRPIAWWEWSYIVLGVQDRANDQPNGLANPLSEVDCLQLRVIAVDEDGNESAPSYPAYKWVGNEFEDDPDAFDYSYAVWESISYPLSQCSAPAPAAPSGLAASYTDMPDPDRCRSTLSWNQVDPTNTDISYDVYRMVFTWRQGNRSFYEVGNVDQSACTAGRCEILIDPDDCPLQEEGVGVTWTLGGEWCASFDDPTFPEALYVVARDDSGSAPVFSQRSAVLWWDCVVNSGVSALSAEPEPATMLARLDAPPETPIAARTPSALGQTVVDPPYAVLSIHVDHLGSTRVVTNASGGIAEEHTFAPYAEELQPVASLTSKKFTSHERDGETGLDYMFARYASSGLGRFSSIDPGPVAYERPSSLNRYSYTENNPMTRLDPTGEAWIGRRPLEADRAEFQIASDLAFQHGVGEGMHYAHIDLSVSHSQIFFDDGSPDKGWFVGSQVRDDDSRNLAGYKSTLSGLDDGIMKKAVQAIEAKWKGEDYRLVRRNCHRFVEEVLDEYYKIQEGRGLRHAAKKAKSKPSKKPKTKSKAAHPTSKWLPTGPIWRDQRSIGTPTWGVQEPAPNSSPTRL